MSSPATLTKLCSFTHVTAGCNVVDPESPVPVLLISLIDQAGQVIPTDSIAYPAGGGFVGDGSGFIRSYYVDNATLSPVAGAVEFSTACCGNCEGGSNGGDVHRTLSLEKGKVLVRFADKDESQLPLVTLIGGVLEITWSAHQTPQSVRFAGVSGDLNNNELRIRNTGGKDSENINQDMDSGFWPTVTPQKRDLVNQSDPFEQTPEDDDDTVNIFNSISSVGTSEVLVTGLAGEFGLYLQY